MSVDEIIGDALGRIVDLKSKGRSDTDIKKLLATEGFPDPLADQLIEKVNSEISKAREAASGRAIGQTILAQIACLAVSALSLWGFIELMALPGNLVPLSLFGIAIVDSLLLTALISIALTAFFGFFAMFKEYAQ